MLKYLTQEWLDEFQTIAYECLEPSDTEVNVQHVATAGPEGDVEYYWIVKGGKITEARLGRVDDADFTITQAYENAVQIQKGELAANTAFMTGKMKVTGNMGRLMALMPLTNSPEWAELQERMRAVSQY